MRVRIHSKTGFVIAGALTLLFCLCAAGQTAPGNAGRGPEASKGLPPRTTPGDYQARGQAGKVTIAAEFDDHEIPDPNSVLSTEDFVVVEVGLYGAAGARLTMSYNDFSLRINGKKTPLPAQGYVRVFRSLKDPAYVPPDAPKAQEKSKGGVTDGTSSTNITEPTLAPIVHIPIEVSRGWEQRVRMASLPEGDRPLPLAGLLFFEHSGKTRDAELIYNGPAGKATLQLQ
ncbi:MAG TPA: hypothetical protein VHY84_09270 [Bryobacteraceae bacterium]|jgi:hypothetical protein|nr:hypothetical protein [Bryobacteraceae bacterium]